MEQANRYQGPGAYAYRKRSRDDNFGSFIQFSSEDKLNEETESQLPPTETDPNNNNKLIDDYPSDYDEPVPITNEDLHDDAAYHGARLEDDDPAEDYEAYSDDKFANPMGDE